MREAEGSKVGKLVPSSPPKRIPKKIPKKISKGISRILRTSSDATRPGAKRDLLAAFWPERPAARPKFRRFSR